MRKLISLLIFIVAYAVSNALIAGEYLTAESIKDEQRLQLMTYTREAIKAVLEGRSLMAPADLAATITRAQNGAVITILRQGKIITHGHNVDNENFLNNIRLAAGRAVFDRKIADFSDCTIALSILDAPQNSPVPAPLFTPERGFQAYQLNYHGKNYFMSPLSSLANQWSWQETLSAMLREHLPNLPPAEHLNILVSPQCTFKFFPAFTLIAEPKKAITLLTKTLTIKINDETINHARAQLTQWWINNQHANGNYAHAFNASDEQTISPQDNAFAVMALAALWQKSPNDKLRFCALRLLDWLLLNYFQEIPHTDYGGIITENGEVDLATNAAVLLAIDWLKAQQNNAEIAKIRERLQKCLWSLRDSNGDFYTIFRGEKKLCDNVFYLTLAITALINTDAKNYGALCTQSLERVLNFFAPLAADKKYPPANLTPWLTYALFTAYKNSAQKKFFAVAVAFNEQGVDNAFNVATRKFDKIPDDTLAISWQLFGLAQIVSWQKIVENKPRVQLVMLRTILVQKLLALQIAENNALWTAPENLRGGFLARSGELSINLPAMIAATLALSTVDGE